MAATRDKGVSLAKGPVGIIGMILLAYGVTAFRRAQLHDARAERDGERQDVARPRGQRVE